MSIIVNTNVSSLKVQRSLNAATNAAATAMERMTTGLRINNAGDDAAGLVISKGIETQQRGSEVGIQNAQNGINLLQTAEGTLGKIQDHMMKIRDLTLQAMNGGYSDTERKALENEAIERLNEINRISAGAEFNEFKIFDAASTKDTNIAFQIGAGSAEATNTIGVKGVFYAADMSTLTGGAVNATKLKFTDCSVATNRTEMEALLDGLKAGIDEVSARRGVIGASSARLTAAVENLTIQNENLSAANSRIKDADIAKESSEYTKQTILQQASAALLVQANQAPNVALTLI